MKGLSLWYRIAGLLLIQLCLLTGSMTDSYAQDDRGEQNLVSPSQKINEPPNRAQRPRPINPDNSVRSIDGSGNNEDDTEMNGAFTRLKRIAEPDYSDGVSEMAGSDRLSPRFISNTVNHQEESIPNPLDASDFLWQWGQFLDHDIDLTDGTDPAELVNIPVPGGDPYFDPDGTGAQEIIFNRSIYDTSTGTDAGNPRQQINEITGWIDASNVYGSDEERANALRRNDGSGKLKTSRGNLLPFNTDGLPNAGGPGDTLFLAGDVRANEQVGLTALHTLFVREHNRLAERTAREHPDWDDEQIYQKVRQIVGAQMQVITYREYLPALLGRGALSGYQGYNPEADARIVNSFSTAEYRYGHSALSPALLRLNRDGNELPAGNLPLRSAFFSPSRITDEGGIAPLLRGLASQVCQRVDPLVIDDVRNFLFGEPGQGGFDLASLNIQRGRDHGLPGYNDVRRAMGLRPAATFGDISSDPEIQERLASAYESVEGVDLWVGGLSEDPVPGSNMGELFHLIIKTQFEALRDGDRFWYRRTLNRDEVREVENTRLSDIIRRNTPIGNEIQDDVFHVR